MVTISAHEYETRIRQLEKLNATLAAECDRLSAASSIDALLVNVELLCTECLQPIRARINTQQWIRVEWIGPSGECLRCYQEGKGGEDDDSGKSAS